MTPDRVASALQLACSGQRMREDGPLLRALLAEALQALGESHPVTAGVPVDGFRFEVRAEGQPPRPVTDSDAGVLQAEALWRVWGVRAACYDRWTARDVAAFPDRYQGGSEPADPHTLGHA